MRIDPHPQLVPRWNRRESVEEVCPVSGLYGDLQLSEAIEDINLILPDRRKHSRECGCKARLDAECSEEQVDTEKIEK